MRKSILILFLLLPIVIAIPSLPCEYWGKVTIDGNIVSGTVKAELNGKIYSSNIVQGYYRIQIQGDDPETAQIEGGNQGDKIILKFQNIEKEVAWSTGSHKQDFNLITEGSEEQEEEQNEETTTTRRSSSPSRPTRTTSETTPTIYVKSKEGKEIKEESFILPSITSATTTTLIKKPFLTPLNLFLILSFAVKVIFLGMLMLIIIIFKR